MLVIIGLYFAVVIGLGFLASKRIKGSEGFYLGGKSFGPWFTAFKFASTLESGTKLVGTPAMAWAAGYAAFLQGMFTPFTYLISFRMIGQRLKIACDHFKVLTVPQLLEQRYQSRSIRALAAIAILVGLCGTLIAQFKATGEIFSNILGTDYVTGLLIGVVVVGIYCVLGGYLATVWTDLMQGIIMSVGSLILFFATCHAALGGFSFSFLSDMNAALAKINPSMLLIDGGGKVPMVMIFLMIVIGLVMGIGLPQQAVALFSMRDKKVAKSAMIICTVFSTLLLWTLLSSAMMGRMVVDSSLVKNPDMIMPLLTKQVLSPTMTGIFIAAILSAIMSTVSGVIVVASSAITQDIMKIMTPELYGKNQVAWDRAATALVVLLSLAVAIKPPAIIFWITIFAFGFTIFTFLMPMIGVVLWKKSSAKAAFIQMLVTMLVIPLWSLVGKQIMPVVPGLLVGLIVAPIVFIAASLMTKQTPQETKAVNELWDCYKLGS